MCFVYVLVKVRFINVCRIVLATCFVSVDMRESPQIAWLGIASVSLAACLMCATPAWAMTRNGPSDRPEAYFNGSSFIQITKPISLKHLAGLSFRTCVGGELFAQRHEGHTLHVTALFDKIVVAWARPGQPLREEIMLVETLDNKWHWLALKYHPQTITLQVDKQEQVLANATYHPWLLATDRLEAEGASLVVGNLFSGCIHEGPQLEFHAAATVVTNVEFGPCPLSTDACKDKKDVLRVPPKDHCFNEPCVRHGTCISRHDRYECHCSARYSGNNCQVDKGPPCASNPCAHGRCEEDVIGNYRCICDQHYHGVHCELADTVDPQCESSPCKNNGSCEVASPGAPYMCLCPAGFTGRNCESDIDECAASHAPCDNGGRCVDAANTYTCDCTGTGYSGSRCELNINECTASDVCGPGDCYDIYGGFVCVCPPPYFGETCQKISACASGPCGPNGSCLETADGFTCTCASNWTGALCDIPFKCTELVCPENAHCQSHNNKQVTCVCDSGYYGVPGGSPTCLDAESACAIGVCQHGATCKITAENLECVCSPGYRGQYCELSAAKSLSERCAEHPCIHAATCVDTASGYECRCESGWGGPRCSVPTTATGCVATRDGHRCDDPCMAADCNGGSCVADAEVGYRCMCPPGVTGRVCETDIDECALKPKICNLGVCVNVPGKYECYCKPGYTGLNCEQDIDECLSAPCKNNGTCHNLENNYECACVEGFAGKDCTVDVDECASSPCLSGATCVDGIGTFECACPPGMSGKLCDVDINDCESDPCLHGGRCVDGLASFTCECSGTGYTGDTCDTNIDECASQPCRNGATCRDQNNDYKCSCHPGFTGKNCEVDIDECESSPCHHGGICLERSNETLYRLAEAPSGMHTLLPNSFYGPYSPETAAGYECSCPPGTTGVRCEVNVDECASSPCAHGKCVDLIGGFECHCDEGYEGPSCARDIDECLPRPCAHGRCENLRAAYRCHCEPGWGGRNCSVPLTACHSQPCRSGGTCRAWLRGETEQRYNCSCSAGHWGDDCERLTTMSLERRSFAEVNTTREEGYDISFRFKTTLGSGLLAMGRGLTYFFLELSSGRLNLHSSLLNKWEGVFIGSNLNDSNWQKVFVTINSSHLVLAANEEQTIYPISQNEAYNSSVTSFPTTRLGTAGSSFATLTHGPNFFVGCFQDVVVNGQWVLPEESPGSPLVATALLQGVAATCPRKPQCHPNPCHSGGLCRDDWTSFSCHCPRPYLGHTCQFNYTAATFGHESRPGGGRVSVAVSESARLAVHAALDISMFVRTRKSHGAVFYLGSVPGSPEETLVAASLKNGELLVHLRFNHTREDYTVGGTRLDNGYIHLIQVVRNSTLVQVKLNGTEYFRKSISAAKQLDAQVLYIGGPPPSPESEGHSTLSNDDNDYFKGVIQDVQISNGVSAHVVEFFPLSSPGLSVPPSFGTIEVNGGVLSGVLSDDACANTPCEHNATCTVTWNDYVCECPRGYKGKRCADVEFCQLQGCPPNSHCVNLQGGYECLSNATFDGAETALSYRLEAGDSEEVPAPDSLSISYRTKAGGTLLSARLEDAWFSVGSFGSQVSVAWRLPGAEPQQRFMRTAGDTENWTELSFTLTAHQIKGAFVRDGVEEVGIAAEMNASAWRMLITRGRVLLGGVAPTTSTEAPSATEEGTGENSAGELFKGCMGPVRIGGLLLPFFSETELFVGTTSKMLARRARWALATGAAPAGCLLCLERDCEHGARCKDVRHSYSCECPPGYEGDRCEHEVDECRAHQCQHGATCEDRVAGYFCNCPPGYTGEYCENDVDECSVTPCANGGTCTDTAGGFLCACTPAWTGPDCRTPRHRSCRHSPCASRATCRDERDPMTGNNYTCVCPAGYMGARCESAFCEIQPCVHGECVVDAPRPMCSCLAGFAGVYCEEDIDECALEAEPCLHGGRCVDEVAGHHCDCLNTGWRGVRCEEDVDECSTGVVDCGPGECNNHAGGYTCRCAPGFCGHECKLPDPCAAPAEATNSSGPCLHGVCEQRCSNRVDYICVCDEGWTGSTCAERATGRTGQTGASGSLVVGAVCGAAALAVCVCAGLLLSSHTRRKRATRGTYSPSGQEYCNPRAHAMQHALKPPPEERLI